MNIEHDQDIPKEDFAELLADLNRLAEAISRQEYPGSAWPASGRKARRLISKSLAASIAAAAAVLLAVGLAHQLRPVVHPSPPQVKEPASAPSKEQLLCWTIPSGIDPSLAGSLTLEVPTISTWPSDQTGAIEWNIPSISFPPLEERSNKHDAQESSFDPRSNFFGLWSCRSLHAC